MFAAEILRDSAHWMALGRLLYIEYNDTLFQFAPKGEEPDDPEEVIRNAEDTRPLGLRNTDNKIISGTMNNTFKPALTKHASKLQRGFVPHRNFLDNIVDLDTEARLASIECDHDDLPAI